MAHTPSQNVLFRCEASGDDEHEPPGRGVALQIFGALRDAGYKATEVENWRDCGWSVGISLGDAEIELALASASEQNLWMLQIACVNDPGLLARIFGKRFIDRTDEVFQVASEVHEQLKKLGCCEIRWRVDGYPAEGDSTSEPQRPDDAGR